MKEIPILCSSHMVQAILAGRKTVTRRTIKEKDQPGWNESVYFHDEREWSCVGPGGMYGPFKVPYQPGDILWVRETYYQIGHWEPDNESKKKRKSGRQSWKFVTDHDEIQYNDDPPPGYERSRNNAVPDYSYWHKRLGRFMPKTAARIWLEVTEVRAERLQDITTDDCFREGAPDSCYPFDENNNGTDQHSWFISLWQTINGSESWEANPWVWVISFKVLSTTGKPEKYIPLPAGCRTWVK